MKSRLASLSDEETAAVRELVQDAVRRETSRGTWLNFVIALGLFAAGVVVTLVIQG